MKKTKIGIIGIGNVGAHVLYTLALQGLAQEFLLIDIDEKKAGADLQDVFDCAMYLPHPVRMSVGTFSDLKDCDIIVYSVGTIDLLRQGHNRLTELNFNIPAAIENARKIKESGFTGILINISNPCDIVTRELANRLGLPKGHVFGTGTGLDTARLVASLSKATLVVPVICTSVTVMSSSIVIVASDEIIALSLLPGAESAGLTEVVVLSQLPGVLQSVSTFPVHV